MAGVSRDVYVALLLVYITFFLDNVLLTVLVPIIPDWIRGESVELWSRREAPLAAILNHTVRHIQEDNYEGVGSSQAAVGVVLGAKATAQLVTAPVAAAAVGRLGPATVLKAATALLATAALVFACCGSWWCGVSAGVCAWGGRAVHGAGAALAGVAGLTLAAALAPNRIPALLGAVALGVLIGYPFGSATNALWSREAPFLIVMAALLVNFALQHIFLTKEEFNRVYDRDDEDCPEPSLGVAVKAGAGAVLLTTSVMAALEPCLPLWISHKFHTERWQTGLVFVPDSAAYLVCSVCAGGTRRPARTAALGQLAVGLAALALPHATSVWGLVLPQSGVGGGLGCADAALFPALLARTHAHRPAALLQAASSAAYTIGPVAGGLLSWLVGFETTLRTLGVLNVLYAALLYRVLRDQPEWGGESDADSSDVLAGEVTPLSPTPGIYTSLH